MDFLRIARLPVFRVPSLSVCSHAGMDWIRLGAEGALRGPDCRHLHTRAPSGLCVVNWAVETSGQWA